MDRRIMGELGTRATVESKEWHSETLPIRFDAPLLYSTNQNCPNWTRKGEAQQESRQQRGQGRIVVYENRERDESTLGNSKRRGGNCPGRDNAAQ